MVSTASYSEIINHGGHSGVHLTLAHTPLCTLCTLAGRGLGRVSLCRTPKAQQIQCLQKSEPGKAGSSVALGATCLEGHLGPGGREVHGTPGLARQHSWLSEPDSRVCPGPQDLCSLAVWASPRIPWLLGEGVEFPTHGGSAL